MEVNVPTVLEDISNGSSETHQNKNGGPKSSSKLENPKYHRGHKKDASSLHEAALTGDLETLKSILKKGKVNTQSLSGPDQTTPLHEAAYANQGNLYGSDMDSQNMLISLKPLFYEFY